MPLKRLLSLASMLAVCVFATSTPPVEAKESAAQCKSNCNKRCSGASNKAKCVGTCRRACG